MAVNEATRIKQNAHQAIPKRRPEKLFGVSKKFKCFIQTFKTLLSQPLEFNKMPQTKKKASENVSLVSLFKFWLLASDNESLSALSNCSNGDLKKISILLSWIEILYKFISKFSKNYTFLNITNKFKTNFQSKK